MCIRDRIIPGRPQPGIKQLGIFWFFSCFFDGILMPFWVSNYSKMVNYRFLIDSTTFWMDSGTFKILSKSGPVALPTTTKLFQKIQEQIWEHPWKIWILEI